MAAASPGPEPSQGQRIRWRDLSDHTARHTITILEVTIWRVEFDKHVRRHVAAEHPDTHFVQIQLDMDDSDPPVLAPELVTLNRAIGHPDDLMLLPGYYLFLDGQPAAYDAGIPDDLVGLATEFGYLLGSAFATWWGSRKGKPELFSSAADELFGTAGRAVSRAFNPVIAQWSASQDTDIVGRGVRKRQRARRVALDGELERALLFLGASPYDSYEQVKRKRRDLLRQSHPDHGGNASTAHELTVTINRSWEYICIRKRWQP